MFMTFSVTHMCMQILIVRHRSLFYNLGKLVHEVYQPRTCAHCGEGTMCLHAPPFTCSAIS